MTVLAMLATLSPMTAHASTVIPKTDAATSLLADTLSTGKKLKWRKHLIQYCTYDYHLICGAPGNCKSDGISAS
ncbi:hypothetical protein [Bifidobacterium asteroides]|uniref:hypothetical protein n=1 Tax=Bifidobacterium sp. ESL0200 TaxID=3448588 RepID=UPI0011B4E1FF